MAKKSRRTAVRKSPRKLRAVQVGCGGRAQTHMASQLGSGAVDLVALCDLDEERLKAAGERYQVSRLYTSMAEMIQKEDPEFVDITPEHLAADTVQQVVYRVDTPRKIALLTELFADEGWDQVLVFTRTKHRANRVAAALATAGAISEMSLGSKGVGMM